MKRRGFLGMSLGAAVAGPGMAKEASMSLGEAFPIKGIQGGAAVLARNRPVSGYEDDLRRQIAGKWLPWEMEEQKQTRLYDKIEALEVRYDALRSVSKAYGQFMVQRERRKIRGKLENCGLMARLLRLEGEEE